MEVEIYFDESGYTGPALLDANQPYFCVASSCISNEKAEIILKESFPRYQGDEFKFKTIWSRDRSRDSLLSFCEKLPEVSDDIFLWVIHKKFCVLTKLIDYLIEPLAYGSGFDFYKNEYAPRYLNLVHFDLIKYGEQVAYNDLVNLWENFAREPNEENLSIFENKVFDLEGKIHPKLKPLISTIIRGMKFFRERTEDLNKFSDSNEIQLTSVLTSLNHWRSKLEENFVVMHDQSNNFFSQKEIWDVITNSDQQYKELQASNGLPVIFPLRIKDTISVDSKSSYSIQFCDILAGLGSKLITQLPSSRKEHDRFLEKLVSAGAGHLDMNGIYPRQEFPLGPPAPRDGPDLVDGMVEILRPFFNRKGTT